MPCGRRMVKIEKQKSERANAQTSKHHFLRSDCRRKFLPNAEIPMLLIQVNNFQYYKWPPVSIRHGDRIQPHDESRCIKQNSFFSTSIFFLFIKFDVDAVTGAGNAVTIISYSYIFDALAKFRKANRNEIGEQTKTVKGVLRLGLTAIRIQYPLSSHFAGWCN